MRFPLNCVRSPLGTHELVQQCHAPALGHRQAHLIVRPPFDPQRVAGPAEDSPDVGRDAGEVVPGVPGAIYPVVHTTAVGVQQSSQYVAGIAVDELLLPGGQLDLALVLRAGSVLREEADPVLGVRIDVPAADGGDLVDL